MPATVASTRVSNWSDARETEWGESPIVTAPGRCHSEGMKLYRPRRGRVFAGVCLAVANRFNVSPTLVRVLTVLSCILPGPQIIIYIVLWVLIPGDKG